MMRKTVAKAACLLLTAAVLLTGCQSAQPTTLSSVVKTRQDTVYYNGYAGLTVTVPEGFYVEEINKTNLTETPEESMDPDQFEVYELDAGGYEITLVNIQNKTVSSNDDHAELYLALEIFEDYTYQEYLDLREAYYLMDWNGYTYELLDYRNVTLGGTQYVNMVIEVTPPEGSSTYIDEYYITEVGGLYFNAYINYWSDSEVSKNTAYEMLETFSFGSDGGNPSTV